MNKTAVIILVIVLLLLAAGGGFFAWQQSAKKSVQKQVVVKPTPTAEPTATPTPANMVMVELKSIKGSSESGTATLEEKDGKTVVTIDITGGEESATQPAHIHTGACPGAGAVKYPLTAVTNGKSATTLDVSFDKLREQLPLAINVHKSKEEIGTYVACGDIHLPVPSGTTSLSPSGEKTPSGTMPSVTKKPVVSVTP